MMLFYLMAKKQISTEIEVYVECSICGKEIDDGFLCRERQLVLCPACQETFPMQRCPHMHGEHQHIRFPGFKDRNESAFDEAIAISKKRASLRKE